MALLSGAEKSSTRGATAISHHPRGKKKHDPLVRESALSDAAFFGLERCAVGGDTPGGKISVKREEKSVTVAAKKADATNRAPRRATKRVLN